MFAQMQAVGPGWVAGAASNTKGETEAEEEKTRHQHRIQSPRTWGKQNQHIFAWGLWGLATGWLRCLQYILENHLREPLAKPVGHPAQPKSNLVWFWSKHDIKACEAWGGKSTFRCSLGNGLEMFEGMNRDICQGPGTCTR
jgi:hypothetical protein